MKILQKASNHHYTASHSIAVHNMAWRKTTERFWQFKMKMFDSILHPASQGFCEPLNIYQWTQKLGAQSYFGPKSGLEFWNCKHFGLPIVCRHADFYTENHQKEEQSLILVLTKYQLPAFFLFLNGFASTAAEVFLENDKRDRHISLLLPLARNTALVIRLRK